MKTPFLIALLTLCPADVPQGPDDRTVRAYELATLTPAEARLLEGRRARYLVVRDSLPDWEGRYTSYDAVAPLDLCASVYFIRERDCDGIVEATLTIVEHRAWTTPDGTCFEAFTEYRLMDTRRD
jgi:hypothetical protein